MNTLPLYRPVSEPDDEWSWTAHYKLPEPLPREAVLTEIHTGVQAMKYSINIPLDQVAAEGLSGVFMGPAGDTDAQIVTDVIFATDPSQRFGKRPSQESDRHAVRIAEVNKWVEVDLDDMYDDTIALSGMMRVIMGRNKDLYGGEAAFTLEETRGFLPEDTPFTVDGGYLFSSRPTWDKPYGESAAIVQTSANLYDEGTESQLFNLAYRLNKQHRFVLEAPWGPEVFQINE